MFTMSSLRGEGPSTIVACAAAAVLNCGYGAVAGSDGPIAGRAVVAWVAPDTPGAAVWQPGAPGSGGRADGGDCAGGSAGSGVGNRGGSDTGGAGGNTPDSRRRG
nr:hypothetical protein GCM10017611_05620 [Rhodococcus wratislaviensis]